MCEHPHGQGPGRHDCRCAGGRVRRFLQPQLLLLLLKKPAHGYDLMERLAEGGAAPGADPGLLYRTLRQLEEEGLVHSAWDTAGPGAARRLYEVSPQGIDYLHAWAVNIRQTKQHLDSFLAGYASYFEHEGRDNNVSSGGSSG